MTETRKFDEQTHWDHDPGGLRAGGAGWAPPGADFFIDRADPYWGHVLAKARTAYGDPNMHFNTDNVGHERRLVFGDGTPVPTDGSLAYHDSATHRTYLLNTNETVSPLGANDSPGQPISPAGFRRTGDTYAPIDPAGHQVAPLTASPPTMPYGYHDANGTLTPKNARGDYYVDDPATGNRAYFDKNGHPITAAQFNDKTTKDPQDPGIPTDEQQSGRAADAVRQLHQELAHRYSQISDADAKLSEVLLNAHATTADGQQKLQAIQHKIVGAINDPAMSLDTPAGEQAFLKFLRSQVTAIGDIVKSGSLAADDQAKTLEALANLYPPTTDPPSPADTGTPQAPPSTAAPAGPDLVNTAPLDAGLGPEEPMPDPRLSDLGLVAASTPAADPLASLASALPAALGALPTGGLGAGLDPLSSLTGGVGPLAGLMSQLADQSRRDNPPDDHADAPAPESTAKPGDGDSPKQADAQADSPSADSQPEPPPPGTPPDSSVSAAPAGAPAPPTAPTSTTVALPDGSTGTARTPALADAVKSYLGGTPVDAAYRDAGLTLPPPGTPVTAPIDPSALTCGAIGMFKDHYVVAVDSAKALDNGQVVPLATLASGPGFLGWMDPAAGATPAAAPTAPASSG